MWVVVWGEESVVGPWATEAQALAYIRRNTDRQDKETWEAAHDFVVKVRTPADEPGYDRDWMLTGIQIRGDD
jgi:hypothetical protein